MTSIRNCGNCGWYARGNVCKFPKLNNFCNIHSDWKPTGKCADCVYEMKCGICKQCIDYDKFESKKSNDSITGGGTPYRGFTGSALAIAKQFHDTYERLAPSFGYETRPETRAFDPDSANGRLMVAVCQEIIEQNAALLRQLKVLFSGRSLP